MFARKRRTEAAVGGSFFGRDSPPLNRARLVARRGTDFIRYSPQQNPGQILSTDSTALDWDTPYKMHATDPSSPPALHACNPFTPGPGCRTVVGYRFLRSVWVVEPTWSFLVAICGRRHIHRRILFLFLSKLLLHCTAQHCTAQHRETYQYLPWLPLLLFLINYSFSHIFPFSRDRLAVPRLLVPDICRPPFVQTSAGPLPITLGWLSLWTGNKASLEP